MRRTYLILLLVVLSSYAQAFVLYDWNLKHLGRARFSTKNVASVISDGDLVMIQEVNTGIEGRTKLRELRDAVKAIPGNENKKICMGISQRPTGGRERYAMLWNEENLVQVDESGNEIKCKENEFVDLELAKEFQDKIVREPAYILLKDKKSKRLFMASTVHALPNGNGKSPKEEIPLIFQSVDTQQKALVENAKEQLSKGLHANSGTTMKARSPSLPLNISILAGDFNMSVRNAPFNTGRDLGFDSALSSGPKTSLERKRRELSQPYDNVFYRSKGKKVELMSSRVVNLYKEFENLEIDTIYNTISDHCPIRAEFQF